MPPDASTTSAAGGRAIDKLLIALLCAIWGSTWIVIKTGLRDLPPFQSAAARFLVAALAMSAVARLFGGRESGRRPPLWLSATVGVCNFALSYGIVYWSETHLDSGITSVLWAVFPMMMAASGHLWLPGERLRPVQMAGFAIGFLGVVLLFLTDLRELAPGTASAAAVLLLSPLVSTIGTTVLKLHGAHTSSILVNRNGMWIGAVLLACAALAFERDAGARWTPAALASVGYLAIVGTALTFGTYFWLLRRMPAHELGLISYVTPAIALALGALFEGERVTPTTLAGSGAILVGVAVVVRGKSKRGNPIREPERDRVSRHAVERDVERT